MLRSLPGFGVTHIVNCRSRLQTWLGQDLAAERLLLGRDRVLHAPMWDNGRRQPARRWSAAVLRAAAALRVDPEARVLVHCQHGRHRSVLVAYAALRLGGHSSSTVVELIRRNHPGADILPSYVDSVERWIVRRGGHLR